LCSTAHGQVGQRLQDAAGRAAERAATQQTERRVEDAVNKGIDAAFDGNTSTSGESASQQQQQQQEQQQQVQQQQQAPPPVEAPVAPPQQQQTPASAPAQTPQQGGATAAEMAYARNDFVPGDEIIFDDDVMREKMGEFPSQWDLLRGNAEVANIGGRQCIYLEPFTTIAPLMKNMKNYLPDVYTIELDFWQNEFHVTYKEPSQNYELWLLDENEEMVSYIEFGEGFVSWRFKTPSGDDRDGRVDNIPGNLNAWNHFALSFNQRALKVYINGVRTTNIPSVAGAKYFSIHKNQYDDHKSAISNIRLAKGAVPLYDRMMSDGKFITYGITFDVGKSTIKPESMGEINRIATLMKENADLKFSVEGHTDSSGSAATNQTLSEARSQAVVDKLVSMGIAADRLKAAGKGQTSPIADNGTDEGRAKNRRVEFVKI
jgi:outer membrane protein OmpA-like peptidoglycan-associated protein